MTDRERLRQLTAIGDFSAARQLAREYKRSPTDDDGMVLATCDWVQLRGQLIHNFDAWKKFAELLLTYPDHEDYDHLNNAGQNHMMRFGAVDIMDNACAKIRKLLSIPEPFSLRNSHRRRR